MLQDDGDAMALGVARQCLQAIHRVGRGLFAKDLAARRVLGVAPLETGERNDRGDLRLRALLDPSTRAADDLVVIARLFTLAYADPASIAATAPSPPVDVGPCRTE